MKKFYIVIALLLALSLPGCGADTAQESAATPTLTATSVATPAPTPSPTVAPTPSPTNTTPPADLQEQLSTAPEIDGLTKGIQDSSVIYTYSEGNPYGDTAGEYAGVYKENVFVEGEQIGGVCLAAGVCRQLLDEALAQIPEGEMKLRIIVPLDISNYDDNVEVTTFYRQNQGKTVTAIKLICNSGVPIVSTTDAQFLDSGAGMLEDTPIRIIYNRYSSQNYDLNLAYNT